MMEEIEIKEGKQPMPESLIERITCLLDSEGIQYALLEHKAADTSEEEAEIMGIRLSQAAKSLIMIGDGKPLMIVLGGKDKVDFKKFKRTVGIKNLQMAKLDQVLEITGAEIGTVPPFGDLFNLPLYVDTHLAEEKEIVFGTGLHTKSIRMDYSDFERITKPILGNYSQ